MAVNDVQWTMISWWYLEDCNAFGCLLGKRAWVDALLVDKSHVDAKIVALGGGSGLRLAALQGGSVDGVMLSMPQNKMAVQMGFRELVFMKDLVNIPFIGLAVNVQRIKNDPDYIVRAIKATLALLKSLTIRALSRPSMRDKYWRGWPLWRS